MVMAWKGGDKSSGGKRTGIATGFRGLGFYLAHKGPGQRPENERIVAFGCNTGARDIHQAMGQMESVAGTRIRVKRPVYHFGFSLKKDKETGLPLEHLTPEQWEDVALRAIEDLGLDAHQVAWVIHEDAGHQHIHIVANRVPLDESLPVWTNSHDHYKLRKTARWTERSFGLSIHPNPSPDRHRTRCTDREFRAVMRTNLRTPWEESLEAFREAADWQDLEERLARGGFALAPSRNHEGGLILNHGSGTKKSLSGIHGSLSGPKLERRFGSSFAEFSEAKQTPSPAVGAPSAPASGSAPGPEAAPKIEPDPVPEPKPTENGPLTVDALLNKLQAHHAVWDLKEARRVARPFENGNDVLRALGDSPRLVDLGDGRYSTREIALMESEVFAHAEAVRANTSHRVSLATAQSLSREHHQVVEAALGDEGLILIQGPAGSGKTTAAKAVADSYRAAGYEIQGAAVAGKAAQGLREATGIDARTLASWKISWENEPRKLLPGRRPRLMIVDEASMLSLQDLQVLLREARRHQAKVVLIGDCRQLPPVGAGDPYRRLLEDYGAAVLTEVHRQHTWWMRQATLNLADGEVGKCLQAYSQQGRVEFHRDQDATRTAMVMQWFEDRIHAPDRSRVLLAYRNAEVRALNREVRDLRKQRGELGESVPIHSKDFAAGDRILFRRNEYRHVFGDTGSGAGPPVPVYNGTLGTVLEAAPDRFRVQLDSGTAVSFDPRVYADIDHGYAVTLHKAQGITVDRAYVAVDRLVDANAFTVAATRHREDLRLYVPQNRLQDLESLHRSVSRWAPEDLIRDEPARRALKAAGLESLDRPIRTAFVGAARLGAGERTPIDTVESRLRYLQGALPAFDDVPSVGHREVSLDRIEEMVELKRHFDVAWSLEGAGTPAAAAAYRRLAEPRPTGPPGRVAMPSHLRMELPEKRLGETLVGRIRALEDFYEAHRCRQEHGPLGPYCRRQAERAKARLDRIRSTLSRLGHPLKVLETPFEEGEVGDLRGASKELQSIYDRLERLSERRLLSAEQLTLIRRGVMGTDPGPTVANRFLHAALLSGPHNDLERRIDDVKERLKRSEAVEKQCDSLIGELTSTLRQRLEGSGLSWKALQHLEHRNGLDPVAVASALRRPGGLGALLSTRRRRAARERLAEAYENYDKALNRLPWLEERGKSAELSDLLGTLQAEMKALPSYEPDDLYFGPGLSRSERRFLPDAAHEVIATTTNQRDMLRSRIAQSLDRGLGELERSGRSRAPMPSVLKAVENDLKKLGKSKLRGLIRAAAPAPVRVLWDVSVGFNRIYRLLKAAQERSLVRMRPRTRSRYRGWSR